MLHLSAMRMCTRAYLCRKVGLQGMSRLSPSSWRHHVKWKRHVQVEGNESLHQLIAARSAPCTCIDVRVIAHVKVHRMAECSLVSTTYMRCSIRSAFGAPPAVYSSFTPKKSKKKLLKNRNLLQQNRLQALQPYIHPNFVQKVGMVLDRQKTSYCHGQQR